MYVEPHACEDGRYVLCAAAHLLAQVPALERGVVTVPGPHLVDEADVHVNLLLVLPLALITLSKGAASQGPSPLRIITTVPMPMSFMAWKSRSHSWTPQFWCGMSQLISSRNVAWMGSARQGVSVWNWALSRVRSFLWWEPAQPETSTTVARMMDSPRKRGLLFRRIDFISNMVFFLEEL